MWVGLRWTFVSKFPQTPLDTFKSRKGKFLSFSSSRVNWIDSSTEFKCDRRRSASFPNIAESILNSHIVKVAQKPFQTLGHIFAKPKDPVTKEQRTDAIYSIPCNDCDNEYIGQTKRQFGTRLKEHQKAAFFCKKENSALSCRKQNNSIDIK